MSNETKKKWMQPGFLVAVMILAAAAVGLNWAVTKLQLHFKKMPVALTAELDNVPSKLGPWLQVSKDVPLDEAMREGLGTEKYIFRDYVDTRLISPKELELFNKDQTANEKKMVLAKLQARRPGAVLNMAVTYYTGMVDTVAHIPDRCYIADGFQPSEYELPRWDMGPNHPPMEVRFINFEDQTGGSRVTRRVAYFFNVNGVYQSDPNGVRVNLQNLKNRYGYYAKVELMSIQRDHDEAAKMMADFLSFAMPEVEKCLPDWDRVENGKEKPVAAQVASR